MRFRVNSVERFDSSSRGSRSFSAQYASISDLLTDSRGRNRVTCFPIISLDDIAFIALSPSSPVPLMAFNRTVSAWSSRVCPRTTQSAPCLDATRERNSYRSLRAASSTDRLCSAFNALVSTLSVEMGTPIDEANSRAKSASASDDSGRRPWSRWAAWSFRPKVSFREWSECSRVVESGPPEKATTMEAPTKSLAAMPRRTLSSKAALSGREREGRLISGARSRSGIPGLSEPT